MKPLTKRKPLPERVRVGSILATRTGVKATADFWARERSKTLALEGGREFLHQSVEPATSVNIPGIGKNDKVFFFAGSVGSVSRWIPKGVHIHSDVDPAAVRIARERYEKVRAKVKRHFLVADATRLPINKVDWLFSHEPLFMTSLAGKDTPPVGPMGKLLVPQAVSRARKGIILTASTEMNWEVNQLKDFLKWITSVYSPGKKIGHETVSVSPYHHVKPLGVLTLRVTPGMRRKARVDERVIMELERFEKKAVKDGKLKPIVDEIRPGTLKWTPMEVPDKTLLSRTFDLSQQDLAALGKGLKLSRLELSASITRLRKLHFLK